MPHRDRDVDRDDPDSRDARVAHVAGAQGGVASTAQLHAAGLTADGISYRTAVGRLHPLFHRVYAVGHRAITRDAWFLAATLSVGEDSGLGFHSAVQHHGLWDGRVGEVHVVVPRRARHQPRIRVHSVDAAPVLVEVRGVRVVRPALAVLQFAAVTRSIGEIRRVAREAQFRELVDHDGLLAVCEDGARGAKRLRRALGGGAAPTRNGGEDRCLEMIRSCGLDPQVNVPLLGFVADFFLPELGLVIEFDGRVHKIPIAGDDDHVRQAVFEAAGLRIMRFDWADVTERRAQSRRRVLAATVTRMGTVAGYVAVASAATAATSRSASDSSL